ncbi:MAG: LysR family transcriptional regulator [Burkholderiaceae bacterium]
MDTFQSIDAFVRVAEASSFADVARQLGVSKSVITSRVQQLEEFVGAPLFHRTTRHVRLSEIGELFHKECADLIARANGLVDQMRDSRVAPTGTLRIHALPGFVLGHMAHLLNEFQNAYPGIAIDLTVNDAVVDPVKEGFDCALQIFPPASEELIERRLFQVRRVFCAAPDYLAQHPLIQQPEDLLHHRLGLYSRYPSRDRWIFNGTARQVILDLKPALRTNSVHMLRDYAIDGGGVVCIPTIVAADAVADGQLSLLLPDFQLSHFWFSAVYPKTQRNMFKLRLFLDHITRSFSEIPPWDSAMDASADAL